MSDGSAERGQKRNEKELATKALNIQYKRYYIDVKENSRGRFIKIAELGSSYKARLVLSMSAAVQVRDHLDDMLAFLETLPEGATSADHSSSTEDNGQKQSKVLKSESVTLESRRYFLDLKENDRGRFLRIAQLAVNPRMSRQQIAIPAQGIVDIRNTLNEFIEQFGAGFLTDNLANANRKSFTADNKTFYVDVGDNDRGKFVRVSEVKGNSGYRTAITLPFSSLKDLRSSLDEVLAEAAATSKA